MTKASIITFLFLIGIGPHYEAVAAPCANSTPEVTVEIQRGEVREMVDTSREQLDHLAALSGNQRHLPAFGVYTSKVGYKADIDSTAVPLSGDQFCAVLKSVRVVIFATDRIIHLARETQGNPCILDRTRTHVARHAFADEQAIEESVTGISKQLYETLAHESLSSARSVAAAREQVAATVSHEMEKQLDRIEALRAEIDLGIDSAASLARLHAACADPNADTL
jgi:hypothetical protein